MNQYHIETHTQSHAEKIHLYIKIIAVLVLLALAYLSFSLVREYGHVKNLDYISTHPASWFDALRSKGPVTDHDIQSIQVWMTFDYINHLFNLPPQYLQNTLVIDDQRYPHVTIAHVANSMHVSKAVILQKVQDAVRAYDIQK